MHAYRYDQITREYLGTCPLVANPRRPDAPCLPAFATDQAPPEVTPGHVARWKDQAWEIVEDHRGERYWLPNDDWTHDGQVMDDLGTLPDGASLTRPEMPEDVRLSKSAAAIRSERDKRLRKSDPMALPDYPHTDAAARQAWLDYRRVLRDVPEQEEFPWGGPDDPAVPWPVEPA